MTTEFLKNQLTRMRVNWRLNLSPEDKRIQDAEFRPLLDKWGEGKFRNTVDRCIREHGTGFFPTVGEFISYEAVAIGPTSLSVCAVCRESEGWVFSDYEHDGRLIKNAARRCLH